MNTLKPGYIPDGWTRGQEIRVLPPTVNRDGETAGAVFKARNGEIEFDGPPADVAMVRFKLEDLPEVSHWVAWWRKGRN